MKGIARSSGFDGIVECEAAEGEGAQVDRDEPAERRRVEPQQDLEREVRLQRSQHGDGGAQHAVGGAAADHARHVREDRAIAGSAAAETADIAREAEDGGGDQGLAGIAAGVAEDVGDGQAVGTVENQIVCRRRGPAPRRRQAAWSAP